MAAMINNFLKKYPIESELEIDKTGVATGMINY